ncbi:hypothetical protein PoB_001447000 [Plakobranchus ocellatus]|uniref:UBZ1-type domain-containing protein n=1 Tax=Plakobranchus ocellatus TaxID=259542 RepID=A0AAV3YXN0_9GAST|nr:hypothetical protein PoB_001447000 [Plakobranchus ocellatus]
MLLSTREVEHDAVKWFLQLSVLSTTALHKLDKQSLLMYKMSDTNASTSNQQNHATGDAIYENFRGSSNNTSAKQSLQEEARSPHQINGWAGGEPAIPPASPLFPKELQTVKNLQGELEESKRNEAHLHKMLKQQIAMNLRDQHQVNGSSFTVDGLPAAPASDGVVESVKDGHIRRLGRELTLLRANLHDWEVRFAAVAKERDSALQKVVSLSALLAESQQCVEDLQQKNSELSTLATMSLQRQEAAIHGSSEKEDTLKEEVDRQRAEISTLKESVQRLSRENKSLKDDAAVLNSRQPNSFGMSSGSNSVACCSQELEYLHNVVDTLKATVVEQQKKLLSLRCPQKKINQAGSAVSQSVEVQSFPIASSSSGHRAAASVAGGSMQLSATNRANETGLLKDNFGRSVDGSSAHQDIVARPTNAVTTTAVDSNNSDTGSGQNPLTRSRSNQPVQDDERINALDNVLQNLTISGGKHIPGLNRAGVQTEDKSTIGNKSVTSFVGAFANPFYPPAPESSQIKIDSPNALNTGAVSVSRENFGYSSPSVTNQSKARSQVLAANRMDLAALGARPLSKSETIAVSSGLGHPSVKTSTTQAASGDLSSAATAQDMLRILGMRQSPAASPSASTAGSAMSCHQLAQQVPVPSGMVGVGEASTALQLPRGHQPRFVFEADIETGPDIYPAVGATNPQEPLANYHQLLPTSSSAFAPQPSSSSVLSNYQTASSTSPFDRDSVQIVNKRMMGGGNMIFQQDPLVTQPFGNTLPPNQQHTTFTAQVLSPNSQQQQQQQQYMNPANSQLGQQPLFLQQDQLDPTEPRCNSDRLCPVCGQDFSRVRMEDFQAHVFECFDDAGPETMKAPGEEKLHTGDGGASDRSCPVCNANFEPSVPQAEFERHVHSHFGEENFEIIS